MLLVESLIFWIFAAIAVAGALGVVFHRSVVMAALFLIAAFMGVAGLFVLNNADFLAVAQVLVYAVGLTIVLLFGVMCTGDRAIVDAPDAAKRVLWRSALGFLTAGALLGLLLPAARFSFTTGAMSAEVIARFQSEGSTAMLGELLMTRYALPFEIASVLLLAAMVGAIVIAKKTLNEVKAAQAAGVKFAIGNAPLAQDAAPAFNRATFHHKDPAAVASSVKGIS